MTDPYDAIFKMELQCHVKRNVRPTTVGVHGHAAA